MSTVDEAVTATATMPVVAVPGVKVMVITVMTTKAGSTVAVVGETNNRGVKAELTWKKLGTDLSPTLENS